MYPPTILESIYHEHDQSVPCMTEILFALEVPADDVALLSRMPWHFPANRIAVERERLGLSTVYPLLHWKLPPPPPAWLTPAVVVKMFEFALDGEEEAPPGAAGDDGESEDATGRTLILPA